MALHFSALTLLSRTFCLLWILFSFLGQAQAEKFFSQEDPFFDYIPDEIIGEILARTSCEDLQGLRGAAKVHAQYFKNLKLKGLTIVPEKPVFVPLEESRPIYGRKIRVSILHKPLTQFQWWWFTGTNPSLRRRLEDCPQSHQVVGGVDLCPNDPVEQVSIEMLNRALSSEKKIKYRLPTPPELYKATGRIRASQVFYCLPRVVSQQDSHIKYVWTLGKGLFSLKDEIPETVQPGLPTKQIEISLGENGDLVLSVLNSFFAPWMADVFPPSLSEKMKFGNVGIFLVREDEVDADDH